MLDWLRARIEALLAKVPGDLFDTEGDESSADPCRCSAWPKCGPCFVKWIDE